MTNLELFYRTANFPIHPFSSFSETGSLVRPWCRSTASLSYLFTYLFHPPPGIDLSAAAHADILFAKTKPNGENDLVEYCDEKGIKYVPFKDFDEALPVVRAVVQGDLSVEKALSGESMRL